MTNMYTIVDSEDGTPTVARKEITIRGYYTEIIMEIVEEHGWEKAGNHVCGYCKGFVPRNKDYEVERRDKCGCDEPDDSTIEAPI